MELTREILLRSSGISLTLALSLGLTGCVASSNDESSGNYAAPSPTSTATEIQAETPTPSPTPEVEKLPDNFSDFSVHNFYTESGHRITTYGSIKEYTGTTATIAFCDGPDLVEVSTYAENGIRNWEEYGVSSPLVRSVGHAACADGRLDPSDFTK